jgi:hypothetical protein
MPRRIRVASASGVNCCGNGVGPKQISLNDMSFTTTTTHTSFSSSISTLATTTTNDFLHMSYTSINNQHNDSSQSLDATQLRRRRRVHFAEDNEGRVLTEVRTYVVSTRHKEQQHQQDNMTCHFAKYQEDSLNAIAEDSCRTLLEAIDKMYFGGKAAFGGRDQNDEEQRMLAMAQLAKMEDGKYRGLESTLMQRSHKRRHAHRKDLLERQRVRQVASSSSATETTLEEQLRRTSRKYSKASTEFALFLAVGDSLEVQHCNDNDAPVQECAVLVSCTRAEL